MILAPTTEVASTPPVAASLLSEALQRASLGEGKQEEAAPEQPPADEVPHEVRLASCRRLISRRGASILCSVRLQQMPREECWDTFTDEVDCFAEHAATLPQVGSTLMHEQATCNASTHAMRFTSQR